MPIGVVVFLFVERAMPQLCVKATVVATARFLTRSAGPAALVQGIVLTLAAAVMLVELPFARRRANSKVSERQCDGA